MYLSSGCGYRALGSNQEEVGPGQGCVSHTHTLTHTHTHTHTHTRVKELSQEQCICVANLCTRPCSRVNLLFTTDLQGKCHCSYLTAAAAKSLQSCPTLCDPIEGSPPGSPIPGILQARTLEWVAIFFSNA